MSSGGFADALRALTQSLEELGSPAAIIRGVAVIAHGVARATVDIDATVSAQAVEPERLVAARPRDLDDIENLLAVHGRALNLRRVRAVVADFAAALEGEERPAILERLLRQAGLR